MIVNRLIFSSAAQLTVESIVNFVWWSTGKWIYHPIYKIVTSNKIIDQYAVISSVPNIFQSTLQKIIKWLENVECLANELITYSSGSTFKTALMDHNRNLERLLKCLQKNNVTLNKYKLKLCETFVKFYDHIPSD